MSPLAPRRFSTMKVCLRSSVRRWASMRAAMSVLPPAENPSTKRTVFTGYSAASAPLAIKARMAATPQLVLMALSSGLILCLLPCGSGALGRLRIPLALAHAGDLHVREHAGLLKRVAVHESLRRGAAADVDDQQAARVVLAIVGERRAGEDQYALLAVEVVEVGLQAF